MRLGISLIIASLLAACTAAPSGADNAEAKLHAQEAANEKLVLDCLDLLFNKKALNEARAKCYTDVYVQHNPLFADGPDAAFAAFAPFIEANPEMSYDIKRSAAKGDLVFVHSHGRTSPEDRGIAVVDIFRLKDGKLVEHWDVMQPIPEEAANENTMF